MKTANIKLIAIIIFVSILSIMSCALFPEETCGDDGEMSIKIGNETQHYCRINALFRDNSLIFKDDVLLINLYGLIFDSEVTKSQMKDAYRTQSNLIELPRKVLVEVPSLETDENSPTSGLANKYNIIGNRSILIQVPFKGKGGYSSDKVFLIYQENNNRLFTHTPTSEDSKVTFTLSDFSISSISEEERKSPEYKGFSDDYFQSVRKAHIVGKLTGTINLNEEKLNINGSFDFSVLMTILPDSKVYEILKK